MGTPIRTIACATHTHGVDVLVGLRTLGTGEPELVDRRRVHAVVPGSGTEEVPLDGRATRHGFLVARAHHDAVPVRENLVRVIIDGEGTVRCPSA